MTVHSKGWLPDLPSNKRRRAWGFIGFLALGRFIVQWELSIAKSLVSVNAIGCQSIQGIDNSVPGIFGRRVDCRTNLLPAAR